MTTTSRTVTKRLEWARDNVRAMEQRLEDRPENKVQLQPMLDEAKRRLKHWEIAAHDYPAV